MGNPAGLIAVLLHSELCALRDNDTPQRAAQQALGAALERWRAGAAPQQLADELAHFARGGALEDFALLAALFEPGDPGAMRFAADLIARFVVLLTQAPLGHVPLRHFTDGTVSTLMLARAGNASLALTALDGPRLSQRPAPGSVSFAPCETWDHVLAGHASGELVTCSDTPGLSCRPLQLRAGTILTRDGAREALIVREVAGCFVNLRLQRRRAGEVTREFSLSDGTLLHQAAGTSRDSRLELTATLLGRMGRRDAAPLLSAIAQEDGSVSLRWQALRECLGLDTGAGFLALCAVAQSPHDPLAVPAGALRAQLIEQYPQLGEIDQCLS